MGTTFQLNFTISAADVATINDTLHQSIVIVKSVGASSGTPQTVAWLHFFEAGQSIAVSWEENYWIYATNAQLQAGAKIVTNAITTSSAPSNSLYQLGADTLFAGPGTGKGQGTYSVDNEVGADTWQLGLAQEAIIQGSKVTPVPLNIVSVGNGEIVTFTPEVTVSIFLQSLTDNGVVITEVSSSALTVTLTGVAPSADLTFDGDDKTFQLATGNTMGAKARRPALAAAGR